MAIPNSPDWSSSIEIKPYINVGFTPPAPLLVLVQALALGPSSLNMSEGTLLDRYWVCNQVGSDVLIRGAIGEIWEEPVVVFSEPDFIKDLSLTFDQLGRPLIFYRNENYDLKFYWFDPVLGENTITALGQGYDPVACFDFPQDTGQSFTDMLVFYIREDKIYMRVQRDRFTIEYDTGISHPRIRLESAGMRKDNRLQVIYTYPGA